MAQFVTHIQPTLVEQAHHQHHPPHHHTPHHPPSSQAPSTSCAPPSITSHGTVSSTVSHHHTPQHHGHHGQQSQQQQSSGHHSQHNASPSTTKHQRPHHIDIVGVGGVGSGGEGMAGGVGAGGVSGKNEADGNTAFLRAARAGNLDKVLEYLKSNIDINTSNANGLNALHLASKDGHVNVVTELLKRGATVDAATKKGNTALHIASLAGQEDVVKILVQNGASVNVQSQNGFTPLYMAAQENHDNVVRFLLANGANQSLATEDGFTPLAVAMQQGHDKVVTVLLENDTRGKVRLPALHIAAKKDDCKAAALLLQNDHNPDVTSKSGFTPLHIAAHYGNENIANLLLQRGADVNYSAKHNITPLHVAAKWGKTNMVSLLIEKGANIEAKTRDGLTPLHCAARSGHEQVVDMLLERGAPISSKTKNGLAPLHMASQGDHVDAARILLYHRAPVDEVTVDYLTALHVAAHCGHVRVAKLLLDRKADPNARALNGFTPLHIACKKNRIKVVELLLKHGASIEATTESGLTPLHVASFMGCMNIVIYLIQHEANPDVPTVRGETPLHLAARANQADIIRILLRNGAQVDARAREQQTPLHIASRLGNVDIVMLLLQHGAAVDATTKDMYTALHIAAKEGQEEVASVLLEHGASLTATTKKGFTPLHLAAKYGKMKVARLLLQRDAPVDAQGKNGVTPLHVASHYDHQNVALLLLDKGASPHATAKNGHTPLHIAARKNQMDIATTLLEYGAKANAESKAGFTPLHLSSQEGHTDMSTLLIEHHADPNHKAKNGLTPLHLCAQEDRVNVATILVKNGAEIDAKTKAGYTPLHVACHFGQINMVRFLLQHGVDVDSATSAGYTPLHQAAQQGHVLIINLLLESRATPNAVTNQGQTALSIAQKLGYISVVETLKVVTETVITTTTTITTEEKYRVMAPETMQETFMSDSEDEGGEDTMLSDQPYRYLTVDEMKSLGDDSLPIDVTRDERGDSNRDSMAPPTAMEDSISPQHTKENYSQFTTSYAPDNVDISRHPVNVGKLQWKTFLVSFMVDARGGAMRGCRHSGVRVIVPPRKAAMPMRITCRYLKKDKLAHPPPLMEGEALASRILELGPVGAKFLGPVIIEVPHFGSLRGKEREIVILRSDNGETWREHTLEASEEAIQDVLNESFDGEELTQLEDLNTNRITRILTTDFPQYFAIVSRVRQEVHAIGPEGGMVSSTVVPQVQAVFPQGALTKKIKVGLQAQPISAELVAKLLGNRVAVSPIVTVEPRRRKFHKPITLTIPVPQAANKGMINQYSGDAPTLRLLCSITGVFRKRSLKGGTTRAQWEDVTGSTPLTFVNDCVSFTTTVSARFWLMDCRNIIEATKMATELYKEAIHVPFMAKFVVFAKRVDVLEARLRVFCMTDDKEDKTLEHQEHFTEVAKSRDVEVLEGKSQFVEFAGNLIPVTKSGDQLQLGFHAFKENRLPFTVRVKDPHADTVGRILFMREAKVAKGEPPQSPICILNIVLPETITPEMAPSEPDLLELEKKYSFLRDGSLSRTENIHRADLRLSDICNLLRLDWILLANELGIAQDDIHLIKSEYPDSVPQQAMVMLRLWMQQAGNKATGNTLEKSLRKINREDIVDCCIFNVELVTDDVEKAVAKVRLDQSGFDNLKEELGPSRDTSLRRNVSLDVAYDEQDIMKESESVEELVAAEKIVTPKEDRITHGSEVEESKAKDIPREKDLDLEDIGEEVRKSIKDYEREEQKYVGEEKEYKEFEDSLNKKVMTKPVKREEIAKKRILVAAEEVDDRSAGKDETSFKISPAATAEAEEESGDEQKRKAEMIAEITEELGRLDTGAAPFTGKEVTSPKISKTPPPSPAEFREGTVLSTKVTHEFPARGTVVGEEQTEYITPDGTTVRQTTITKTTKIMQGVEPSITEEAARLAESETWQSDDLDLSVHPEELSSVQEWTERMQQKQTAGREGIASEDTGISPLIPDMALNDTKTTSDLMSIPLDTKMMEFVTAAMSSSVTSTTTTTSDALVSDLTATDTSKKTCSSPDSPVRSGVDVIQQPRGPADQSPKRKDMDKGSSESTTAPTSSMAPQLFPFLSSTSTSADRALIEELTPGGIHRVEVESALAGRHPSSNLDQFETKTEDEVPDLLDDELNSPEYAKPFVLTSLNRQNESLLRNAEEGCTIGYNIGVAVLSPEDKRTIYVCDTKSEPNGDGTSQPYVTTPTLQRRSFSRGISGKVVRGTRPSPLEVVQLPNECSEGLLAGEQNYIVTEPGDDEDDDDRNDKWSENMCRINSSPDIISLTDPHPLQFIKTVDKDLQKLVLTSEAELPPSNGNVESFSLLQELKHRPIFRLESSEDEGDCSPLIPAEEFLGNIAQAEINDLGDTTSDTQKFERKVRKAERRFERIASQSLEEDRSPKGEDGDEEETPSARERSQEIEFQRMTSQLSTEELAGTDMDFQKVFTELLEEPSEDWDSHSHDLDTPEREVDSILPEDDNSKGGGVSTIHSTTPSPLEESRLLTDGDHMERIKETPKVEGLSHYSPAAGSKIFLTSKSHPTPTSFDPKSFSDDHDDISLTRQITQTGYYSDMQPQQPSIESTDVVEEKIQSYSDRKKFWEQMTTQGGKQVVEESKENIKHVLKSSSSRDSSGTSPLLTPVPRPRTMVSNAIASGAAKPSESVSSTTEIIESDTETGTQSDSTIRMRLFADAGQSTFTGSDMSDQEVDLDSGNTLKETSIPASLPIDTAVTMSSLVAKSLSRDSQAESSDSEAEYLAKRGGVPMAFDNRAFVGVDKIDTSDSVEETVLPTGPSSDVKIDEYTPLTSQLPSAAPRRIYERSVSLPTEVTIPSGTPGFGGGVRAKKQFFEAQIKKEMAVEQLMTQPEEEPSPEHKAIFHQEVSSNGHSHTKPVARLRRASEGQPVSASHISGSFSQSLIEPLKESFLEVKEEVTGHEAESLPYGSDQKNTLPEETTEETSVKSIIGVFEKKIVETYPALETSQAQSMVEEHEFKFSTKSFSTDIEKDESKPTKYEGYIDDIKISEMNISMSQVSGVHEEIQEKGEVERAEKYLSAPPSEEEMSKSVEDNAFTVSELDISEEPVSDIIEDAVTSLSTSRLISETDISSETKIHADVEEHHEKDEVKLDDDLLSHDQEKEVVKESGDIGIMESKDILSSRVTEMLQYKTEVISRPSDSLEVHVDKSEIEGTEKERELEEDMEDVEREREEEGGRDEVPDEELEKADRMKKSSEACDMSLHEREELEKISEFPHGIIVSKEVKLQDRDGGKEKDIYMSKQQFTLWEVPVQESSESMAVEIATDIPIEKQVIIEKDEGKENLKCAKQLTVYQTEEAESINRRNALEMTKEEAINIAKEVIDEIEVKVAERTDLMKILPERKFLDLESISPETQAETLVIQQSGSKPYISDLPPPTSASEQIKKTIEKVGEWEDSRQAQLVQSVLAKHHKEQICRFARGDTASSIEITDEDLRSSGADADLSPVERLQAAMMTTKEENEEDLAVIEKEEEVEVVKKTLAEVRESLEAAQEELLEEHKKKERKEEKLPGEDEMTSKKKSPSEFEFKVLDFQKTCNKFEDNIEETLHEDTVGATEYTLDGIPMRTNVQLEQKENLKVSVKEVTEEERKLLGDHEEDGKELITEEHVRKYKDLTEGNVRSWESSAKEQCIAGEGNSVNVSNVKAVIVGEEEMKHTSVSTKDEVYLPDSISHETTSLERDLIEGKLARMRMEEARKETEDESDGMRKKVVEEVKMSESEIVSHKEEMEEFSSEKEKSKLQEDSEESVTIKSEQTRRQTVKETTEDRVVKECSKTTTISEQKIVQFDGTTETTSPSRDLSREFRKDYEDKKRQFKVEMDQKSDISEEVFVEDISVSSVEKQLDTLASKEKLEPKSTAQVDPFAAVILSEPATTVKKAKVYVEECVGVTSSVDEAKHKTSESTQMIKETKMFDEEYLGRTSSEDEAGGTFKSPPRIEESSSSSSIAGKRLMGLISENETVRLERPDGATVVLRRSRPEKRSDAESSGSGGTIKGSERRSGADIEGWSSSGESHYQSFEQTSDSGRTFSRPCSSDFEGLIGIGSGIGIGHGTTGSSEYETALSASADYSGQSGCTTTSQDYRTAVSSLSSRESMKSLDSESSGHLASIEVSSEASETLVPSALELERDMEGVVGSCSLIIEDDEATTATTRAPTSIECKVIEPYDTDIPVHIIKGEPRMPSDSIVTAGLFKGHESLSLEEDEGSGSGAEGPLAECPPSPFEIISESEVAEYPGEVSEPDDEEAELPEHEEVEDSEFPLGGTMVDNRSRMKRSIEMTFHPEPRPIITNSPHSETPDSVMVPLSVGTAFSLDYGQTPSSVSITSSFGTVIEANKHSTGDTSHTTTDSDKMDASIMSEQLSGLTSSVASDHLSIEDTEGASCSKSISDEKNFPIMTEKETAESSTSTGFLVRGTPSSVTITTSSVETESGVQSVCTQVTSEVQGLACDMTVPMDTHSGIDGGRSGISSQDKETEDVSAKESGRSVDEFKGRNGPTEVEYTPEYDDFEDSKRKTPRELGHRRKESTSFVPSMIPRPIRARPKESGFQASKESAGEEEKVRSEEMTESDKYQEVSSKYLPAISPSKLCQNKDHLESESDEVFEADESYHTEADQGFHRDLREGRVVSVSGAEHGIQVSSSAGPSFEVGEEEDPEAELKELVESRPQSTAESLVSKSDSEGGHRPFSSEMGFSDDRPDSELTELLKQFSDGSGKDLLEEEDEERDEIEDPIERPKSPEPPIDYSEDLIVKEEDEEVSSETQTSVAELNSKYSASFTCSQIDSVNDNTRDQNVNKKCISELTKVIDKTTTSSRPMSPTSPTHPIPSGLSPEEDDMAEAEAAFQMVPRITPTLPAALPATILEIEEEATERLLFDTHTQPISKVVAAVVASDIPDITVTEHLTPKAKDDDEFTYPDTLSRAVADTVEVTDDVEVFGKTSTPQTPASVSSHASERSSENTDTDQGQEYVLGEELSADGDAIFEEPEEPEELTSSVASIVAVPVPGRLDGECTGGKGNADLHEVQDIPSTTSFPGSPTSDSFEMIEKAELPPAETSDAYIYVEEVAKEAMEELQFHKQMTGKMVDVEDSSEDLFVSLPPSTRMTEIKYYPAEQPTESPFSFDQESPLKEVISKPVGVRTHQGAKMYTYEMSFERAGVPGGYGTEVETEYDREVEAGKKWIEMQFQGELSSSSTNVGLIPGVAGYGYEMDFERGGPLEDIEERREEEEQNDGTASSSKVGSLGSCKESLSSTPEYDVLAGRKFFTRSGEHDDVSMSSLQEFERLEREIVTSGSAGSVGSTGSDPRRTSLGSQDSLNGGGIGRRPPGSRNGHGDDISLSSLQEFERLESACIEAAKIESRARQEEAILSEIEEGHESQVSESESCETISETGGGNAEEVAGNNSDSDDYEKRMFEIDEIIRQAQSNVEQFEKETSTHDTLSEAIGTQKSATYSFPKAHAPLRGKAVLSKIDGSASETMSHIKKSTESISPKDNFRDYSEDVVPELDLDASYSQMLEQEIEREGHHHYMPHVAEVAAVAAAALATATVAPHAHHAVASRTISTGSAHSTTTQFDMESLKERRIEDYDDEDSLLESDTATAMTYDLMQGSTDSIEPKTVISDKIPVKYPDPLQTSTDSLEFRTRSGDTMTTSADSIEFQAIATSGSMVASTDSLELDQQNLIKSLVVEDYRDTMTTSVDSIEEEASCQVADAAQGLVVHDHSSSSGREGDLSSSGKEEDSGGIGLVAPMGGRSLRGSDPQEDAQRDPMVCSTDSLEPSSSTATHATYQYETDSVMSSSFTSGGSATMVSSTDTLDPEAAAASLASRGPQSPTYMTSAALSTVLLDESYQGEGSRFLREGDALGIEDSAIGFTTDVKGGGTAYVTEVIEPVHEGEDDEASGFSHVVHRTVRLPPTIQHVTFSGPDAEAQLRSYVKQFAPGEEEHESEETDKDGNMHVTRVVQKRFVLAPEDLVLGVDGSVSEVRGSEAGRTVGHYVSDKTATTMESLSKHFSDGTISKVLVKEDGSLKSVDSPQMTQKTVVTHMTVGHDLPSGSSTSIPPCPSSQDPSDTFYLSRPGLTSYLAGETGGVEHLNQEDASATFSTPMRGSEFYQMQDPEGLASSEYDPSQTTTQSRVVTTRTHTRTIVGEDGRPVTVTTTETDVGSDNDAEGILGSNQLRESMQQIIDQFGVAEDTKEGRGKKEEKPE